MKTRSIDPTMFRLEPSPRLIGGRHRISGRLTFPLQPGSDDFEPVEFPTTGTLWSYTVQRIAPKSPPYRGTSPFEPFAVGYVELPDTLIVESRLNGIDFADLRIGLPLALAALPLYRDEGGAEVVTFVFTSAGSRMS